MEKIDFIDEPKDPRRRKRDEHGDDDDDFLLPLPRFWRETVLSTAQARNLDRNYVANGRFKQSTSYIREKLIQKSQRLAQSNQKRIDPRLERSLFLDPPRKIASPSNSKPHNSTQPEMGSGSIFDCDDMENVSSDSSGSSSPNSFGSLPSVGDEHYNAHSSTKVINSDIDSKSDSDEDYSFGAFKKKQMIQLPRRTTRASKRLESSSADEKVPPIKIDLKKKLVQSVKPKKPQSKFTLF